MDFLFRNANGLTVNARRIHHCGAGRSDGNKQYRIDSACALPYNGKQKASGQSDKYAPVAQQDRASVS